jgi:hypothetical protein
LRENASLACRRAPKLLAPRPSGKQTINTSIVSRRLLAPLAAVALLAGSAVVALPALRASAAAGPFTCVPGFYQVISGQLKQLDPVTGTYTNIGAAQPTYNAMGYDTLNNYLYALSTAGAASGDLLQIANDGSINNLGLPTNLPAGTYVAGDFDNAGNLIIRSTAATWYSIDVATNVATVLTITGAADAGNDLVWINGSAYLLNGTTLYAVNLSTDVATSANVAGIISGAFGAAWSDSPNDLFFSDNNTGHIYLVNGFTTASPTGALLVTGITTSNNDGAACKNAANPFEVPVANADTYSTPFNTALTENAAGGVLANDVGAGITVTSNTAATGGTVLVQGDGSFVFTPTTGSTTAGSFSYTITDAFNRTSTTTVTVSIVLPSPPNAVGDSYSLTADGSLTENAAGGLLANDTGTLIAVTGNTTPANGGVTVNTDGSFVYTPNAGFSGTDTFNYTITDEASRTSTATVTLLVSPVAANVTASGAGPAPLVVTPTAAIGTGPFTYALTSTPPGADGTAVMNATTGQITFTPAFGFHGAVPVFTYTATDAAADVSAPATISLTITEPAPPVANNDSYTVAADGTLTQAAAGGLLTNDTGAGIVELGVVTPPAGTVHVNPDGSFVYTPVAGYSGPDSFTYDITDEYGRTSGATVTITVDPVAIDVSGSGPGPGAIVLTPTTPIGTGPFTYQLVTTPPTADGTASINVNTGAITFTPAPGFHGSVPLFTYDVTDTDGDVSAPANIDVSVGTPTPPTTVSLSGTTPANDPITLTPPTPTGTGPFTFTLATLPSAADGVATIDSSTGAVTFAPAHDFSGIVPPFTYTVTDAYSQVSAPENVSISVTPLGKPAAGSGPLGEPITVQPPAPVGTGPFTYHLVPGSLPPAADGTVTIDPTTGAVTFTPAPGFTGDVTVQYTVTDGDGLVSAPANVTFAVAGAATTVPNTGAVETPMVWGFLLLAFGLVLAFVAEARRPKRI